MGLLDLIALVAAVSSAIFISFLCLFVCLFWDKRSAKSKDGLKENKEINSKAITVRAFDYGTNDPKKSSDDVTLHDFDYDTNPPKESSDDVTETSSTTYENEEREVRELPERLRTRLGSVQLYISVLFLESLEELIVTVKEGKHFVSGETYLVRYSVKSG